jgi:hypothetical protein
MPAPTRRSCRPHRWLGGSGAVLLLFIAALWPQPADAQWRWRDANGRITVSDRPPPREIADKDILSRPSNAARQRLAAPAADAASAAEAAAPAVAGVTSAPGGGASAPAVGASRPPSQLQAEVEARRKRAEQEQAARAKAEEDKLAAQRAENCRRARSHVATLESGQRIARVNERGEREILDDRARADEMRTARAVIASDCR